MNKSAKHLLIATSLFAGLIAAGESSRAASLTVPAKASPNANDCFSWGYSYMRNDCSTTQTFYLPAHIPWSGQWMYPAFSAYGASPSNNVGCLVRASSIHGTSVSATPKLYLSQFGISQLVDLIGLPVPYQASLAFECEVYPGGRLNSGVVLF